MKLYIESAAHHGSRAAWGSDQRARGECVQGNIVDSIKIECGHKSCPRDRVEDTRSAAEGKDEEGAKEKSRRNNAQEGNESKFYAQ